MSLVIGGKTRQAYLLTQQSRVHLTFMGDSLLGTPATPARYANQLIKRGKLGGNITALLCANDTFFDVTTFIGNETDNQGNDTNTGTNATYGYWGTVSGAGPTADEYYGIPVAGFNWRFDGDTETSGGGKLFQIKNPAADPFGGVNTVDLIGDETTVFRYLFYGATGLNTGDVRLYNGSISAPTLLNTINLDTDVRPLYSEGDDPQADASPRSGGHVAAEANAAWPDVICTTANGLIVVLAEGADNAEAIAAGSNINFLGNFGYVPVSATDPTWGGGVQIDVIGASSWDIPGFADDTASSGGGAEKKFDDDNWLHLADNTVLDLTIPRVCLVWLAPEAKTKTVSTTYTQRLIDKITNQDAAIGKPTPIVILVINPKTSLTTAQMDDWRDGIVAGCESRSNAGYIDLYEYYGHDEAPGTDPVHPNNEAAAAAIFDNFWRLFKLSASNFTEAVEAEGFNHLFNLDETGNSDYADAIGGLSVPYIANVTQGGGSLQVGNPNDKSIVAAGIGLNYTADSGDLTIGGPSDEISGPWCIGTPFLFHSVPDKDQYFWLFGERNTGDPHKVINLMYRHNADPASATIAIFIPGRGYYTLISNPQAAGLFDGEPHLLFVQYDNSVNTDFKWRLDGGDFADSATGWNLNATGLTTRSINFLVGGNWNTSGHLYGTDALTLGAVMVNNALIDDDAADRLYDAAIVTGFATANPWPLTPGMGGGMGMN